MKRIFTLLMAAASLMACTRTPYEEQIEIPGGFTATIEGVDTRTSMDGLKVLWASGDQVAVFAGKAINERYEVTKVSVGKPSANFTKVGSSEGFGSTIPTNVAYYPYSSGVELDWSGEAAVYATLPETQTYAAGSFGQGAFPMMAVTKDASDRDFAFRNVCGVLKIQLTGLQKVKTIEFQGNDDEVISGDAVITSSYGDAPSVQMTGNGKAVTLDCGYGVQLSSTPTDFCIVLPPMTFTKGFTVSVTDTDGMTMEISTDKSQTISRSGILKMPAKEYDGTSSTGQPSGELCFTAETANSTIALNKEGNQYDVPQEYCADGEHWYPYTFGTTITLANVGDKVYFRKMTDGVAEGFSKGYDSYERTYKYYQFAMSGRLAASGNVMSLVDRTCQSTTIPNYNCFYRLFYNCTSLTQAPELPATTLADRCYAYLFEGCAALTQAPDLPATTLDSGCYDGMFCGCTALTQAPELPATTLASWCYGSMFSDCTSLTQAPELPATTMEQACYYGMFEGCTSLTQAPDLPATTLDSGCYYYMFYGCTSLNEVRCHATDISEGRATEDWLYNVSSTGTFYADPSAHWSRGTSGIPVGWTVKSLDGTSSTGKPSGELCFTAETAGSIVALNKEGSPYNVPQEYCTDGEHWYPYTFGTPITLANVGEKVYFRRITDGVAGGFSKWYSDGLYNNYYHFSMSGRFAASGSVMSLVDRSCQSTILPRSYYFYKLFEGCTALTQAPELPATTMADHCYDFMFHDCTALVQAPKLPATTLADYCYNGMFYGCTALTQAPELPATSLTEECYGHMFSGCTALTQAPELPATGLADWCYAGMFEGCTALTKAPELPATTLADCCYAIMFSGCTALTKAPELPATMLASFCYDEMFYGCTALTQAPELPATTLTESCYIYMFNGCTALKEVKCYAIDISSYGATANWLSGVSSTGTFYADPITNWSRGTSGIPEGWEVKSLD